MGYAERRNAAVNQLHDDLSRQRRRITELEQQLADAMNGRLPPHEQLDPAALLISSIVSHETGEPVIKLRWFTHLAQLRPDEAQEVALNLLRVAEIARCDAFLARFARARLGVSDEQAALLLDQFRLLREAEADEGRDDDNGT